VTNSECEAFSVMRLHIVISMIGARLLSRSRSLPKLVDRRDVGVEEGKNRSKFVVRSSPGSQACSRVRRISLVSVIFHNGDLCIVNGFLGKKNIVLQLFKLQKLV
jgi:hypothetical protein